MAARRKEKREAAKRASRSGRKSRSAAKEAGDSAGRRGQVVAHHGVAVLVRFEDESEEQIWLAPEQRAVVGDWVRVHLARLEVEPADRVLQRRDARGRERTIAVNLDLLALVVAAEPREPPGYLDRGFVIARAAGIEPCIIVNKMDLEDGPALADRLEAIYGAEAKVHRVSADTGAGLDALGAAIPAGHLAAFVGASGVGKSSITNALVPDLELRVSELNRASGHGRHTTTTATMHGLAGGGNLVDTAGFKDFIAVDVSAVEAAAYFPGFAAALEAGCRFRDCGHRTEPDCAVLEALEANQIESARHRSYLALLDELASSSGGSGGSGRRKSG